MAIEAPLSVRATEESKREAAQQAATQYLVTRAYSQRDQRVEEAKESAAQRPTVADRAAETPQRRRPATGSQILDILT